MEEYAASRGQIPPRKRKKHNSIYVCTIEKANALVNSLISEDRLSDVGLMVVDEVSKAQTFLCSSLISHRSKSIPSGINMEVSNPWLRK